MPPCVIQIRCAPAQPGALFPIPGVIVPAVIAIGGHFATPQLNRSQLDARSVCNARLPDPAKNAFQIRNQVIDMFNTNRQTQ